MFAKCKAKLYTGDMSKRNRTLTELVGGHVDQQTKDLVRKVAAKMAITESELVRQALAAFIKENS